MQIPPVSGPTYTQGPTEDPSKVFMHLKDAWMVNPNRETAQKLLQYIQQHHPEFQNLAEEKAEGLDEKGLPFPEVPFEKAYKQAIEFLKNWIDGGCDNTKFAEIRTKVMELSKWVTGDVFEEGPLTESISPHISPMALQASNKTSVPDRLDKLVEGYKKAMQEWTDNPSKQTLHKLEKAMAQITGFLREHKEEIFKIAKNNGWPTSDPGSDYENYFQSAMDAMKNFKKNPNMGSAVFANECLTQIHWLLTNAS